MKLHERIQSHSLPIKQLKVVEAILEDLESHAFLTGHEICAKFNISFSSLTRLSQSLKYTGFPEFKRDIEQLYKSELSPSAQVETFLHDSKNNSILNMVFKSELDNLNKLRNGLSEIDLNAAAKKINRAKRVFIVGVGQLQPIVAKFSERLCLLGKTAVPLTNVGFSKMLAIHSVTHEDMVIAFSINKELVELKELLEGLKEKKVPSMLFTDKKASRLIKLANTHFIIPSTGNGMINSITPFIVVTNVLEAYLFSLDKYVHLTKIKNIENKWSSLPLFLN